MSKIIGNTVGMGLPKPNLMQNDPTKGDYVLGKEAFLAQAGAGSGQDLTLDTTLTKSGAAADAKAVGDALAEVGKPTDEQVAAGVEQYISKNPGAVTSVVDKSITPGKTDFLEIRTAVEPEELTWVSAGYNMIANDGYLDIRGVDTITVVHTNATGREVALALYADDNSQIQGFTVISNPDNQAVHYLDRDTTTHVTILDIPALIGDTNAVFAKIRVQQNTNNEYGLAVYLGDNNAEPGFRWSDKYGSPKLPDGAVTLDQTNFIVSAGKNLFDTTRFYNSGFNGPLFDQFGSNMTVFADYIDVSERKTFYIRAYVGAAEGHLDDKIGCYDADKNLISADGSLVTITKMRGYSDIVIENQQVISGGNTFVYRYEVDDSVKFVRIVSRLIYSAGKVAPWNLKSVVSSYDDILDMVSPPDQYWRRISDEWRNAIQDVIKPTPKTMVMIGDSLTNWGGGGDGTDGFLRIVHDKTGVITANEGTAGAWWQTAASGQPYCAVKRVDKIIADGRKYDLYCFLMGTNAGANTDTGETSADTSTMPGAIRYCLEKLKAYDPTAQILVCLPPQRAEGNENQEKVNEVIAKICGEYAVPTLDIYHRGGIVPNTKIADIGYLQDGLHLAEPGYTVLGNLLAAEVKYLLCL